MSDRKFSVVIVTLNAGEDLLYTVSSVLNQTYSNIEIIVKDGMSIDHSIDSLPNDSRIKIIQQKDNGIYNAMNQAVEAATGDYILFMNTGDSFFACNTIESAMELIGKYNHDIAIYFGDCYTKNRNYILRYQDQVDDYFIFTKVICHQSTIYEKTVFTRKFSEIYKIAADYDFYVRAYANGIPLIHIPLVISTYKGDGMSESAANRKLGLKESKRVLHSYFKGWSYWKTFVRMQFHGVGIKHFFVKSKLLYPLYCKIAKMKYGQFISRE